MKILLDNGIFSHSEFVEPAIEKKVIRWAGREEITCIHGVRRIAPNSQKPFQAEINALPTVGRIIRENLCEAFDYKEIWCERMRFRPLHPFGNALNGCIIRKCNPAIERTKFAQTIDLTDYFAKGGKKDRKAGIALGAANQIAFLKQLCSFTDKSVDTLISYAEHLRLTDFEIANLRDLEWYKFLCKRSGSTENYPDVFHLWTAERNGLDILLTLDNHLPELVSRVRGEKKKKIEIRTQVLRPLEFLHILGIQQLDPVPLEQGRFYYEH